MTISELSRAIAYADRNPYGKKMRGEWSAGELRRRPGLRMIQCEQYVVPPRQTRSGRVSRPVVIVQRRNLPGANNRHTAGREIDPTENRFRQGMHTPGAPP